MISSDPVAQMERMLAGHFVAQSLHVAAVLGIADHIAAGRETVDQLAVATGTRTDFLERLLLALASIGVIAKSPNGHFALSALGNTLKADAPASLRDKAIFEASAPIWGAVAGLVDWVRDGAQPFHASTTRRSINISRDTAISRRSSIAS